MSHDGYESERLFGCGNALWKNAPALLAGGADGVNALVARLDAWEGELGRQTERSVTYFNRAGEPPRDEAERLYATARATVAVLRAATILASHRSDRADEVAKRLNEAIDWYGRAWAGGPTSPARCYPPAWWAGADLAARLAAAELALAAAAGDPVGVGMVRSGLATAFPAGWPTEPTFTVRFPVLLVLAGRGRVLPLTLDLFPGPAGGPVAYPDPEAVGCTWVTADFRVAVGRAVAAVGGELPPGARVRWAVGALDPAIAARLTGPSLGGAFATGLLGLARRLTFDKVSITAQYHESAPEFRPVEGEPEKVQAAYHAGIRRVVLADRSAVEWEKVAGPLRQECPGLELVPAKEPTDALEHLTGDAAEVCMFLERLAVAGPAAAVRFLPDHVAAEARLDFLLPAQVVDEVAYQATAEASGRRPDVSMLDRDYLSEQVLRGGEWVPVRSLDDVWAAGSRVVVRGEPGEGKTTALWRLAGVQCRELAAAVRGGRLGTGGSGLRLPLVLPLNEIGPTTDPRTLARRAADHVLALADPGGASPRLTGWVTRKLERGEYDLYLDALDELADLDAAAPAGRGTLTRREWLRRQLRLPEGVRVLLTTRFTADDTGLFDEATRWQVVPLEPAQVREYVERYFGPDAAAAHGVNQRLQMSPGPRQLARLPLLLALLCDLRRRNPMAEMPATRTALLGIGLMGLLERGDDRRNVGVPRVSRNRQKRAVLEEVAWQFHAAEPRPMGLEELLAVLDESLPLVRSHPPADADALLQEFREDGVLVPRGVGGMSLEPQYGFVLRSFHEFGLAGWIAHRSVFHADLGAFIRVVQGDAANWQRADNWPPDLHPLTAKTWAHVWPLVGGQLEKNAGRLLSAIQDEDHAVAVAAEVEEGVPERRALIAHLSAGLADPGSPAGVRDACAGGLGRAGGPAAVAALSAGLADHGYRPDQRPGPAASPAGPGRWCIGQLRPNTPIKAFLRWPSNPTVAAGTSRPASRSEPPRNPSAMRRSSASPSIPAPGRTATGGSGRGPGATARRAEGNRSWLDRKIYPQSFEHLVRQRHVVGLGRPP